MIIKTVKWLCLLAFLGLILFLVLGPAVVEKSMNVVEEHEPYPISEAAAALHASLVVGDWHADSPLWKRRLHKRSKRGHVDLPRLQEGNVMLQMFTTVTKSPSGQNYERNEASAKDNITTLAMVQLWPKKTWKSLTERALYQAGKIHKLAERKPDDFKLITSQAELAALVEQRKSNPTLVGGLIGTEGSHALDGKLENIQRLYDKGFRMMSLHHFFDNKLGASLHGTSQTGLTEFGREAVRKMWDLDIIIDVSHSSEQVVKEVLAMTGKPLVVSHTGFKGHCDSPRNISDDLMQQIAAQRGLIAVGYWDGAICGNSPQTVAEAINYGIQLVGADHVALGSDFDGTVTTSFDTSELAAITQALMDIDVPEGQIRKVMGGNMLRLLQENLPAE
ncbi:MAG: dipeptidase [Pseudomonadota bacterium]